MPIQLIGAGVGRTGTTSLHLALQELLGGKCYHMLELRDRAEHIAIWARAARGDAVDWQSLLEGYQACVDWPAAAFWREISDAFPDAPVLLSHRPATEWYRSASATIFPTVLRKSGRWREMIDSLFEHRFTSALTDEAACITAYQRHNAQVRAVVPTHRLVEWQPGDGWAPICGALGLPVPAKPFPHENTTAHFRSRLS
ncbi:MAG: sulfotransferase [Steroidobacteraceae bacterium]